LVLSGTTRSSGPGQPSQSALADWNTSIADDNRQLLGGFTLIQSFRNDFGDQQLKLTCLLEGVQR
jgi:hypothetical protein